MWPFRKRTEEPDPHLERAETHVANLVQRATRVERHLRPRLERNHWSETVDELWRGRPA